jgi:hypothetical protein
MNLMNLHLRQIFLFIALAALSVLSGCWTYSLQPVYSDDDPNLTYEPALEGTWKGESNESITMTGDSKSKKYQLEWVRVSSNAEAQPKTDFDFTFSGRLVELGAERFLDVVPERDETAGVPGMLPAHSVFKVSVQGDALFLSPLNVDWLCSAPQADQAALGQCIDGDFILTTSTDVLQEYVRDHSDDEQVFPELDDSDGFRRVAKPGSEE